MFYYKKVMIGKDDYQNQNTGFSQHKNYISISFVFLLLKYNNNRN